MTVSCRQSVDPDQAPGGRAPLGSLRDRRPRAPPQCQNPDNRDRRAAMDATARPRADSMLENRTFDEIAVGDRASLTKTIRREDIELFAVVTGDINPAHLDAAYAETDSFH